MTAEGTWNPRVVDDHETVEEMMKRFPPTDIEATDLFYTETGDIDHNHILNNYQANMESMNSTKSMKSIKWNPVLSETNDGAPFIPEYKKLESSESNPKFSWNRMSRTRNLNRRSQILEQEKPPPRKFLFLRVKNLTTTLLRQE